MLNQVAPYHWGLMLAISLMVVAWFLAGAQEPKWKLRRSLFDLLVFDFDGVMTDNKVIVDQNGVESVRCCRGDGMGVSLARKQGLEMLILSTETNPVVATRAAKLKLPVIQGSRDKLANLQEWLEPRGIPLERVVFVGNDVNDSELLDAVGFGIVVADAHNSVQNGRNLVLSRNGGEGAVRELIDRIEFHA